MMIHKLAEWRERVMHDSATNNSGHVFCVVVMYSREHKGFVINGSVKGTTGIYVSSQRQEKRVFKTLDTVRRSLNDVGIIAFDVLG